MEVLGGSADTFDWVNFVALKGSTPKKEETETPVFTRKTMESNQSEGEKEKESLHKSMNTVATVSSSLPSRAEKREAFASRVLARIQQNAESKTQKRSSASPGLFPSPTQSLASNKALIEKFKLKVEAYQDKHVRALERERETLRERQQAQREPPAHWTRNVDDVKRQSGAACMKKNKTLAFEVGLLDGHRVGQHNHNQEEDEDAAGACVGSQDDDLCPEPAPLPRKMFSQDLIFEGDLTLPSTSKPRPPLEVQEIEATEEKDEDEEEEEEEEGEKEEVTTTVQDIQDLSLVVEALKRKLQEKNEEIVFLREDNHALRQGLDTSQDYIQGFGRKYGQLLRQTLIAKGLMSEVNSYLCKASKGEEQDVDEVTCRIKRCNKHQHQQGLQGSEDPNYLLEQKLLQWIDKENEKEKESISSISSTHIAELYKYPGETLSQAFVNEVAKVATRMNDLVEHLKTSNPSRTASTISM